MLGQQSEKRKQKTKQSSEMEISISPMFKWLDWRSKNRKQKTGSPMSKRLGRRSKNRKQQTRQLWETEFNIVRNGLDEEQVVNFVSNLIAQHKASQEASAASLRSPLETAVADAEQVAASINIKMKTQIEAEDILSVANRKAEITEVEAKQKALLFLIKAREEIEKEVRAEYERAYSTLSSSLQNLVSEGQNIEAELKSKRAALREGKNFELEGYEAALLSTSETAAPPIETSAPMETQVKPDMASKEKVEEPVKLEEEAIVSEPAEAVAEELLEQHLPGEGLGAEETDSAQLKLDSQTLYAGEIELAIAIPVKLNMVSKLYNHLQTIPEIKILRTTGSWDRGTTITVVLEKPIPLISLVSKIPGVEATSELPQKDSLVKGTSSSLPRAGGRGVKRIKLTLKEV